MISDIENVFFTRKRGIHAIRELNWKVTHLNVFHEFNHISLKIINFGVIWTRSGVHECLGYGFTRYDP